ncbi:hypothetical protein EJB05_36642, partial [Eragrostis curvula]
MNSNRSAMVDVESNLSAAAEEEMARFPVVDSEEEESSFAMAAEDLSKEEYHFAKMAAKDPCFAAEIKDKWNARYACYFGPFEGTIKIKPRRKLSAEEKQRARFQVETKPSDMEGFTKMVAEVDSEEGESGFAKMTADDSSEELGPDQIFEDEASCFKDTWIGLYSPFFGHFEDTSELFTLRSNPWKGPVNLILNILAAKIPNMRFTSKKPRLHESPVPTATLQIFSLKIAKIWGGLQWPLHVFGMVAVRDVVDHNRNMIFHCRRESCQILTHEGVIEDEDKSLSFLAVTYNDFTSLRSRLKKRDYASKLSTVEFELGSIVMSVEATISLRVRPGSGSWPYDFSARISARTTSIRTAEVVLLDSWDDSRVPISGTGSIKLSRAVVSVEIMGELEVCVQAGRGEDIVVHKRSFKAKKDSVSHGSLRLGFCILDVTIAWSLVST